MTQNNFSFINMTGFKLIDLKKALEYFDVIEKETKITPALN